MGQSKHRSQSEVQQAFRDKVKTLRCPTCDTPFTDAAVDWADAWWEGRADLMAEQHWQERDGPYKLKCAACGQRAWLNYFAWSVRKAEEA
jgi:uncharacterized C2H2 Zn-finger protein